MPEMYSIGHMDTTTAPTFTGKRAAPFQIFCDAFRGCINQLEKSNSDIICDSDETGCLWLKQFGSKVKLDCDALKQQVCTIPLTSNGSLVMKRVRDTQRGRARVTQGLGCFKGLG